MRITFRFDLVHASDHEERPPSADCLHIVPGGHCKGGLQSRLAIAADEFSGIRRSIDAAVVAVRLRCRRHNRDSQLPVIFNVAGEQLQQLTYYVWRQRLVRSQAVQCPCTLLWHQPSRCTTLQTFNRRQPSFSGCRCQDLERTAGQSRLNNVITVFSAPFEDIFVAAIFLLALQWT